MMPILVPTAKPGGDNEGASKVDASYCSVDTRVVEHR